MISKTIFKIRKSFRSTCVSCLFFSSLQISAQSIPSYNCSVYDSTLTGYFFLTKFKLGFNGNALNVPSQLIVDTKGELIYFHSLPKFLMTDFKIQPNGKISYFFKSKYYIADSMLHLIDSINCSGYETDAHDLQILNNGHYLILGTEHDTMDLSSYNYFFHSGFPGSSHANVASSIIQELDYNKNVVFEWHSKNHFAFGDVDPYFLNSPNNVDWTHCNAVEKDFDGNILLSTRHFNEITKIDFATGNIIWRLGGNQNQFTFYGDTTPFRGQHDIRRIANGHITLFDNGKHINNHDARGLEYAIDEVNKTATLNWVYSFAPTVSSFATGNVQRLANGNSLISFGFRNNSTICFTLIDSAKTKLFELFFPDTSASYRAFYYPQLLWSLYRPLLNCYQQGNDYYLQTSNSFSKYLWSTGETTSSIKINSTGNYFVYTPYGEGFIKSEIFQVSTLNNPCNLTNVSNLNNPSMELNIKPNPFSTTTTISFSLLKSQKVSLQLFDVNGKLIKTLVNKVFEEGKHQLEFNSENVEAGIYFLRIQSGAVLKTEKFVVTK